MNRKLLATAALTIFGVLATSNMATAEAHGAHASGFIAASPHAARGNANLMIGRHVGPARTASIRNNRGGSRSDDDRRGTAILGWPYYPTFEEIPVTANDVPSQPQVIVVSGGAGAAPSRGAPDAGPDYSFVAGCRAIPNGYHCDPPRQGAATH
jgi:hypothetical protein